MQNFFFLGIILVGKEKISKQKHKTIQKQQQKRNQSITFCCGDCRNKHEGRGSGRRAGDLKAPPGVTQGKSTQEKGKRPAGAQTTACGQKEMKRVWVFSAVGNSEKHNNTCGLL